jgi:large subunit ribosomal protein L35
VSTKVKAKSRKAAKKRLKITGTGKLLRRKMGRSHIMTKKSSRRKRNLEKPTLVSKSFVKKFTRLIIGL